MSSPDISGLIDAERWLGAPPPPLARVLDRRLELFARKYAVHQNWPVVALPRAMAEVYGIAAPRDGALADGCALFFLAADVIDDAQDGALPEDICWSEAVTAGQALLFAAIGAFAFACPGAPVAREIHEAGRNLVAGQAIDLASTWDDSPDEDTVMAAVRGKSGASLAMFARMGAYAAQRSPGEVADWGVIGESLGTALQLRSDVLDLRQADSRDWKAQRGTLPVAYAVGRSGGAFAAAAAAGDREAALDAMRLCGALTFVEFKIDALVLEVQERLDMLELVPAARDHLRRLVEASTAAPVAL